MDGIEFDVHLSLDGEVVVQHDYRLNPDITRNSQGEWLQRPTPKLVELSLPEIRRYDVGRYRAGSRPARSYPDYGARDREPIPTLDEFIGALALHESSNAELWLELKTSPFSRAISSDPEKLLDTVLQKLDDGNMIENTVLLAFEWDLLVKAQKVAPSIRTNFLSLSDARLQALYPQLAVSNFQQLFGRYAPAQFGSAPAAVSAAGGDWWGPLIHDVSAEDVLAAKRENVLINAWGVGSTPVELDHALSMELDAITVARPDLAGKRLRGESLPADS